MSVWTRGRVPAKICGSWLSVSDRQCYSARHPYAIQGGLSPSDVIVRERGPVFALPSSPFGLRRARCQPAEARSAEAGRASTGARLVRRSFREGGRSSNTNSLNSSFRPSRVSGTQVGYSRLGQYEVPISGKPEIGGRNPQPPTGIMDSPPSPRLRRAGQRPVEARRAKTGGLAGNAAKPAQAA